MSKARPYADSCYADSCYAECRFAEYRYAECHYAECRGTISVFLKVYSFFQMWGFLSHPRHTKTSRL